MEKIKPTQVAMLYGIIDAMLEDLPKAKRERYSQRLEKLQGARLIPVIDWTNEKV